MIQTFISVSGLVDFIFFPDRMTHCNDWLDNTAYAFVIPFVKTLVNY